MGPDWKEKPGKSGTRARKERWPRDCRGRPRDGVKSDPSRAEGSYLQKNPVTFLGSQVQHSLSHYLLSLAQRHVVKVPVVEGISEFFT